MGNSCCSDGQKFDVDQNMNKKLSTGRDPSKINIKKVVRMQALVRGFLTRRVIRKIYGFEMSRGLLMRGTV